MGTAPATSPGVPPANSEHADLVGREIAGRYRVLAKLGEGGMGAVYRAEQISLKRTVAVKLLRPEVASSQLLLRRFNAEAEAVAKLSHPNTVNIYDFGQDTDGTLFIAMEYIEGKSLRHVVQREAPLPLRRALMIAQQIAASLVDAHAQSIVHRDLKPDNVMLQERGRQRDVVRVLDFGIAKLRDENRQTAMAMTQAGDMLGTPQYMAPEQIRAENIDGRTDVYALGCMLYEMITARLPYEAPTVMALLSKHLLENAPPPSQRRPDLSIPPAVDNLVMLAMAKDQDARPATMEQFGEQIDALLATLPFDTQAQTGQQPMTAGLVSAGYQAPAPMPTPPPAQGHPLHPTPSGYLPPGPGAPPYDPHANRNYGPPMPQPAKAGGGNAALWVILIVLLLGGAGAGIYVGFIQKNGSSAGAEPSIAGMPTPPTPTPTPPRVGIDAASSNDPWTANDTTRDDWTNPTADSAADSTATDDTDLAAEADDGDIPVPARGQLPASCENYIKLMERYASCSIVPKDTGKQLRDAAKQMRSSWSSMPWSKDVAKQIHDACKQGADAMRGAMASFNCN
ncbi:MAG: protein kinase [Kofleriaceae bacterium]|nr:protein kinase [Kofleriaceae bacterium]